jgi:hypothetical protein
MAAQPSTVTPHTIPSTALSSTTAATILSAVSHIGLSGNTNVSNSRATRISGKSRKRQIQNHPVSFSAVPNSFVDKNNDFMWYDKS